MRKRGFSTSQQVAAPCQVFAFRDCTNWIFNDIWQKSASTQRRLPKWQLQLLVVSQRSLKGLNFSRKISPDSLSFSLKLPFESGKNHNASERLEGGFNYSSQSWDARISVFSPWSWMQAGTLGCQWRPQKMPEVPGYSAPGMGQTGPS